MLTYGNHFIGKRNNYFLSFYDPYNPLHLPANTLRVRVNDGNPPVKSISLTSYETATLVAGTTDVYDVYKSGDSFKYILYGSSNVIEVLGANTTGISDMESMFHDCTSLVTIPLFDTSDVTNMTNMFANCWVLSSVPLFDTSNVTNMAGMFQITKALTTIPLLDTSNVTNMDYMFDLCESLISVPLFDTSNVTSMVAMFYECASLVTVPLLDTSNVTNMTAMFVRCYAVESGALALYQQASTQTNPPSSHSNTFRDCGSNTTTGAAELAQIPSDWK